MDSEVLMTTSTELLTPKQVAALFGVDPVTVKRWALAGKLSAVKTYGGHRRYRADQVLALRGSAPPEADLLTRAQVARLLGVQPGTVTAWASQGKLTSIDTPGCHRRYRADEVRALLAQADS
jgi:excisionase family DNA binding protein